MIIIYLAQKRNMHMFIARDLNTDTCYMYDVWYCIYNGYITNKVCNVCKNKLNGSNNACNH